MTSLWQRFVLAMVLVFGLALGIAATVFGYSNTDQVTVNFLNRHFTGVPLWAVAIVPLALAVVVGLLYHWWNSLRHFAEHMRHRRRIHDLEAELASLKAHLDQVLEMPDHGATPRPATTTTVLADTKPAPAPEDALEPVAVNGDDAPAPKPTEEANSES